MTENRLDAYCGLYCGACISYQCTQNDDLATASAIYGRDEKDLACDGCRTGRISVGCGRCMIRPCAVARGHASCSACSQFPCGQLSQLMTLLPHLGEVVGNLEQIRVVGHEHWCAEQAKHWTCPSCGKTTWWYETTCRSCGAAVPAGYTPPTR